MPAAVKRTVESVRRVLGKEFVDFLIEQQPDGSSLKSETIIESDTVLGVLINVALSERTKVVELKGTARQLKALSDGAINYHKGLYLVAAAKGYRSWPSCMAFAEFSAVRNARLHNAVNADHRFKLLTNTKVNLMEWDAKKGDPKGYKVEEAVNKRMTSIFIFFQDNVPKLMGTPVGMEMLMHCKKHLMDVRPNKPLVRVQTEDDPVLVTLKFFGGLYGWMERHGVFVALGHNPFRGEGNDADGNQSPNTDS